VNPSEVVALVDIAATFGFRRSASRSHSHATATPRRACGHRTETDPCFECFYQANRQVFTRWSARLCDKHDVLDMSEEVFLDATEKLFVSWKKGTIDNPRAYMYTVLQSKAIDAALRRGIGKGAPRPGDVPLDAGRDVVDGGPNPESEALRAEQRRIVKAALCELPKREQDVATCRYVLELSSEETAARLAITRSAVSSALDRANRKLRIALDPDLLRTPDDCGTPRNLDGGEKE
jgi:RNA polymerase sigma factor (sigma-70 family)